MRGATGPRLIIICGLPGAGKTTLAKRLQAELSAVRMCPDEWMNRLGLDLNDEAARGGIEALQWSLSREILALGGTVVIEWGTWARSERDTLRSEARELGAAVELRPLAAPLEELFARIQRRGMEDPPIPWESMREWEGLYQIPTPEEIALYDPPRSGLR